MDSEFYSKIGKKGAEAYKIKYIKKYYENPNYCKYCGEIIELRGNELTSITKQRKFCSKECQSQYQKEYMQGNQLRKKYREPCYCLNCGKELSNKRKYCDSKCKNEHKYKEYIKRWKQGLETGLRGKYQLSHYIERYIKEKYNNECCICGWHEINPYTGKIPLEIHHDDGDYTNNTEDNLKLLCPNCHSLTSTYKNAGNHDGRKERSKYKLET